MGIISLNISPHPHQLETLSLSKYTNKLIGNTAFMLLNKPIGKSTSTEKAISGEEFAQEMYDWKGQGKDVTVKINSMGGNVKYGWDMVDSIIETKAKTENIGYAYSMAGICLIVGSDRTAYPHSRAMIHAPRRDDGKKDHHTELIMDQFRTILKNHTKFTDPEINDMIDSGKDYFFNAKKMLEKGMVDKIATTGGYNNDVMASLNERELYTYINEQEITEPKNYEMEILAKLFGKGTESENLISAIQMKAENETLKGTNAQLATELAALKTQNDELSKKVGASDVKTKAVELINAAEKSGKLSGVSAVDKDKWVNNATENFDLIKGILESMPAHKSVSVAAGMSETTVGEGNLTYEWLAKNDPEKLKLIAETETELYGKLSAQYIEKQKSPAK